VHGHHRREKKIPPSKALTSAQIAAPTNHGSGDVGGQFDLGMDSDGTDLEDIPSCFI
jgi:hypothetical protein